MFDLFFQIVSNWLAIWTSGSSAEFFVLYEQYIIGTVILFMPVYIVLVGMELFGVKFKPAGKVLNWTIATNAMLAFAPCTIPLGIIALLTRPWWRRWFRARQNNTQNQGGDN